MDKHLKLKDILPYFDGDDEILQVSTDDWDSEVCDIFHADSTLLKEFSDWDITDMGSIEKSVLRVVIKKEETEYEKLGDCDQRRTNEIREKLSL